MPGYRKTSTVDLWCLLVVCLPAFLLLGCAGEQRSEDVIVVPEDENIPYGKDDPILINQASTLEVGSLPEGALNIRHYLSNPDAFAIDTLDIFVSDDYCIRALQGGRLLILDLENDQLTEYHPSTRQSHSIASSGPGPGELAFSKDVVTDGTGVYVARADRNITVFECSASPCVFKQSISIDLHAYSIALVGIDSFAVRGSMIIPDTGGDTVSAALQDTKAIYVFGHDGTRGHSFGATYDTEGHWMLLRPFVSQGSIHYVEGLRTYVISFGRFPFLYVYDALGSLVNVFRIEDFIIGRQQYWPDEGRLMMVKSDHSVVSSTSMLNGEFLLVEVTTRTNSRVENQALNGDIYRDYYGLNVETNDSYYLGQTTISDGSGTRLAVVPAGLIVDRNGTLLLAQ